MGLYDITLLWADKSVILFSLTGIKGISKTDYICCDFKKVWDMTGKPSPKLFPREQTLQKNNAMLLIQGIKPWINLFFPPCGKYIILPLKTARVGMRCYCWISIKSGDCVCNQALQINMKEKAEHEEHLNCLMKTWICADFADPFLIVKAPSPAGDKIHKHFLTFPFIFLLKPSVTGLWCCSISQDQYV